MQKIKTDGVKYSEQKVDYDDCYIVEVVFSHTLWKTNSEEEVKKTLSVHTLQFPVPIHMQLNVSITVEL